MKINDVNRVGSINSYRNHSQGGKGVGPLNKGNAKDEVHISEAAKQLLGSQAIDSARAEKIADLKHAVLSGTYYVDGNKVAEKLLPYLNE